MDELRIESPRPQEPLRSTPFHEWVFPDGTRWTQFHRTESGYLLRFPGLADYTICGADLAVSCCPEPDVDEHTINHLYLNQVFPLVMSQRGTLVFHGSAIEVGASAVLFMGEAGRGKSTLAASFAGNGLRFLADDGVAIVEGDTGFRVQPSHPSIRLWADSHAALMGAGVVREPSVAHPKKARFLAGSAGEFCPEPRDVGQVYFLGDDTDAGVVFTDLPPADALIALVKHSFLLDIQANELLASHFDRLSRLVQRERCFRLDYPRRFEALPDVRAAILKHCDR